MGRRSLSRCNIGGEIELKVVMGEQPVVRSVEAAARRPKRRAPAGLSGFWLSLKRHNSPKTALHTIQPDGAPLKIHATFARRGAAKPSRPSQNVGAF